MQSSKFCNELLPTDNTFSSRRFSRPESYVILFLKSDRSVNLRHLSRPSIFVIRLKERSSHCRFTNPSSPLIFVMMLLSNCSLVSFSIPCRLSISTMSMVRAVSYFCRTRTGASGPRCAFLADRRFYSLCYMSPNSFQLVCH